MECTGAVAGATEAWLSRRLHDFERLAAAATTSGMATAVRRFETPPGKQVQVDWGHLGYLETGGERCRVWGFTITLGYSRRMWAQAALDQKLGTLLRMHEAAFRECEACLHVRRTLAGLLRVLCRLPPWIVPTDSAACGGARAGPRISTAAPGRRGLWSHGPSQDPGQGEITLRRLARDVRA